MKVLKTKTHYGNICHKGLFTKVCYMWQLFHITVCFSQPQYFKTSMLLVTYVFAYFISSNVLWIS